MFEQATLSSGPAGKRVWTTFLGLSSQMALVGFAALAPMVWPQGLPITRLAMSLAPPAPPGPRHSGDKPAAQALRKTRVLREWPAWRYEPDRIPDRVYTNVVDEPNELAVTGGTNSDAIGWPNGVVGSILTAAATEAAHLPPPLLVEKPAAKAAPVAAPTVPRLPQGGDVKLGRLIRKVQPQYPEVARAAHVWGEVQLECVVGIDGRMVEVKVKSGNPLLTRAASDAVWQWVYESSRLNGKPIEIITNVTVSFKLN
jgi:TonB family protein